MSFSPSRFMEYNSVMIHKTVFQYITIKNIKIADFGGNKTIPRHPYRLVCYLMQLTEAFLIANHSEDISREGRNDRKLQILRYYQEINEAQRPHGQLQGGRVGNFPWTTVPRSRNPLLLDRLEHVNSIRSCTNGAGLKQPVKTVHMPPKEQFQLLK